MGLAEQFAILGEDCLASFDARATFLTRNVVESRESIHDTHRFLAKLQKEHKARARKLRAELGGFVNNLRETVLSLRRKNRRDCKDARLAWQRMARMKASKHPNPIGAVASRKQKACGRT